jgi:hypothetical protein
MCSIREHETELLQQIRNVSPWVRTFELTTFGTCVYIIVPRGHTSCKPIMTRAVTFAAYLQGWEVVRKKYGTNHSAFDFAEVVFKLYNLQLFSRVGFIQPAIEQPRLRYLHDSCKTRFQVDHRASFTLDPTISPEVNIWGICTEARCVFLGPFPAHSSLVS